MNKNGMERRRFWKPNRFPLVGLLFASVVITGCSDFLDDLVSVELPSGIEGEHLDDPSNAEIIVNGTIADFECAFGYYTLSAGVFGEELADRSNEIETADWDRRTLTSGTSTGGATPYGAETCGATAAGGVGRLGVHLRLSTAWRQARDAAERLSGWSDDQVPERTVKLATVTALQGYVLTLMAEGLCSWAFDGGPEEFPSEIFLRAEAAFNQAEEAAQAASDQDLLALSRLGRARVRLNQGRIAEAAVDAALVPPGFVYYALFDDSNSRRFNRIYEETYRSRRFPVEEMYLNLSFAGQPDPRVSTVEDGVALDLVSLLWLQTKYTSRSANIPLARWEEAQLILAEAALEEGNLQEAVDIINDLHAKVGLPAFNSSDSSEIRNQIIYERRAELFLESHHLGDRIRYAFPLVPQAGSPYPGLGETYGSAICIPIPDMEKMLNPHF